MSDKKIIDLSDSTDSITIDSSTESAIIDEMYDSDTDTDELIDFETEDEYADSSDYEESEESEESTDSNDSSDSEESEESSESIDSNDSNDSEESEELEDPEIELKRISQLFIIDEYYTPEKKQQLKKISQTFINIIYDKYKENQQIIELYKNGMINKQGKLKRVYKKYIKTLINIPNINKGKYYKSIIQKFNNVDHATKTKVNIIKHCLNKDYEHLKNMVVEDFIKLKKL